MDIHPNNQPSMHSLLHSSSPPGEAHDILQRRSSAVNGTYISTNGHPEIACSTHAWTSDVHSPLSLERKLEDWGQLRLPPDTGMDNSSCMARYLTDDTSSRPLIGLESNTLGNAFLGHGHNPHLSVATSWNGYQSSYHDSADASSAVSSTYDQNPYAAAETTSTSAWTGSPDGHRFREADFAYSNMSPTSPEYTHWPIHRKSHSPMEGCLSPTSPGFHGTQPTWRKAEGYSTGSNSGNNSPGEAEAISTEICLNSQGSYVNLKSIQLKEKDEERDGDEVEEVRSNRNSVPDICFHRPETTSWRQYFTQSPMEIECSTPSPRTSPPGSPRTSSMLEAARDRRPRSGSGASLSIKERAGLMKPYKDTFTGSVNKNHKGRGAGKKHKERQRCPEHPGKSFRHDSEFRYPPLPVPIAFFRTGVNQLTAAPSCSKHMQTQHTRPFLCTFYFASCNQTFGSKNEWKRHVFSQHLQLHYWRCDHTDCTGRKAFFNRKDLFGQHLKRMHGPSIPNTKNSPQMKDWLSREIPLIQERCRKMRRSPPEWSKCGYCLKEFKGEGSWDMRMEHVGKHYEKNNYKNINTKAWVMDEGLVEWAIKVGIVERTDCGDHKLVCSGKDSIEGEERRKSQMEQTAVLNDDGDDGDEDAEGEDEYFAS